VTGFEPIETASAVRDEQDRARLSQIARDIQSDPETDARRAVLES
jgi:hypothetical protein